MDEYEAREWYLKFEYTRVINSGDADLSSDELALIFEMAHEYEWLTNGEPLRLLTTVENEQWYAGVGNQVRAVLGDYVQF